MKNLKNVSDSLSSMKSSSLNDDDLSIHRKAVAVARQINSLQAELVEIIEQVEKRRIYRRLGYPSLFKYVVDELSLTEAVAYAFITVARKSSEYSRFKSAIQNTSMSVYKAGRIASLVNESNVDELMAAAEKLSTRELDRFLAKYKSGPARPDSVKFESEGSVRISASVSPKLIDKIRRAQEVTKSTGSLEEVLDKVFTDFLNRHDPLVKAERSAKRLASRRPDNPSPAGEKTGPRWPSVQAKLCARRVGRRKPIPAFIKRQVHLRDGCQCTHIDGQGRRCENRKWLQIHHIQPVSQGGANEVTNLTTLCSAHHDLVHQLSLPLEGQVTWLREGTGRYWA